MRAGNLSPRENLEQSSDSESRKATKAAGDLRRRERYSKTALENVIRALRRGTQQHRKAWKAPAGSAP